MASLNGGHPVFVKLVHHIRVERRSKYFEVRVPLRRLEKDRVVRIHLSYGPCYAPVERLQMIVILAQLGEMRDRLVQQIVANHRLSCPDIAGQSSSRRRRSAPDLSRSHTAMDNPNYRLCLRRFGRRVRNAYPELPKLPRAGTIRGPDREFRSLRRSAKKNL